MLSDNIIDFYKRIEINFSLPEKIQVLNHFNDESVQIVVKKFYKKYYNDSNKRILILGINPGRFGAGITGIPFTDPVQLEETCLISNNFEKKRELSSEFIYGMISAYGGVKKFYSKYFIGAVSPLGFVSKGKNYNYYDSSELQDVLSDYILYSIQLQIEIGCSTDVCYCLGQGKNYKYLQKINKEYGLFKKIIPLAHPRYIMQYKRKLYSDYINLYLENLS